MVLCDISVFLESLAVRQILSSADKKSYLSRKFPDVFILNKETADRITEILDASPALRPLSFPFCLLLLLLLLHVRVYRPGERGTLLTQGA